MSSEDTHKATDPDGTPTHERIEQMDDEERQAFEEKKAELDAVADEAAGLDADEQEALDALTEPLEDELETVELRQGVTVQVKTYLSGEMEDNLSYISEHTTDLSAVRGTLVETIAWLIEDEKYGNERVWQAYADNYGVMSMAELFFKVVTPVLDRMEDSEAARRFRQER